MTANRDDPPDGDEPFLSRWSRKKQQAKRVEPEPAQATAAAAVDTASPAAEPTAPDGPVAARGDETGKPAATPPAKKALTEADFADVDFDKLDYGSDYGRFMQTGVPENIRQKALSKLWHSDEMFTQVDPFQDYAGDYTDAAVVPAAGMLKTAYKVGQGFLSDEEAHTWDRLGKPDLTADMLAVPVLRPGFRVRPAVDDDGAALVAVQTAAILAQGAEAYDKDVAASWAQGLTADPMRDAIRAAEHLEVAIQEDTGDVVAFCGTLDGAIQALFVAPRFARKGLASRLLARAETSLLERGLRQTSVVATRPSRALYLRQGYRETSTRMNATRGGAEMEVFEMSKPLIKADEVQISKETPDQPEVRAFFAASEAYMGALYPAESNHFVDASTLAKPNVIFLVARAHGGLAIGCGAIVKGDDGSGEIKRMWIDPAARGLKLGARILTALETAARADGVTVTRLETGNAQPEALSLYRRAGYAEIGPFGNYQPDPLSVFMEKQLS